MNLQINYLEKEITMTITRSSLLDFGRTGLLLAFEPVTTANPFWPYWSARQIAQDFRVNHDYPQAYAFPVGYFRKVLKPGMSIDEVHEIVREYETVYACNSRNGEVYYFFSSDPARALRLEIIYDREMNFDSLGTEDVNQRTISVEGQNRPAKRRLEYRAIRTSIRSRWHGYKVMKRLTNHEDGMTSPHT
jgi:hypothetical protein